MSKKKSKKEEKEKQEEKVNGTPRNEKPSQSEPVAEESVEKQAEEIINETEQKLKKQIDELRDTNLRLIAEFDNYKKRTLKEKIELTKTASEEVISALLPVLDDFERALQNMNNEAEEAFKDGIKLIYKNMFQALSKQGLDEIQAMNQDFDTDFHEAISHVPAADENQKNKIIDVVQKGYKLHGKVIRYAKVVVGS